MKITYIPYQPHCYAFGGFEVQMLAAFDAAKNQGCNISLLDPWSRVADFDIVHVWGFAIGQHHNITYSKQAGKKIVVTALMPDFSSINIRLRFMISSFIDKAKILKAMSKSVDCFVTVNDVEKEYIVRHFNYPAEKIKVIPNIISDAFLQPSGIDEALGINDYVLCVGNICQRKNQLNLVRACNQIGFSVLLVGNIMEGEEAYGESVMAELGRNPLSKWIKGVKENSTILRTAYKHCKLFALISYRESQPISVLEALAMNCKVLLADKSYAYQIFYKNVSRVDPGNIREIKKQLLHLAQAPLPKRNEVIDICKKENVGKLYKDLYDTLQ